jgi:hypothetical protein
LHYRNAADTFLRSGTGKSPRFSESFLSRRDRRSATIAASSIYQIDSLFSDLSPICCHLPANPEWNSRAPKISANEII